MSGSPPKIQISQLPNSRNSDLPRELTMPSTCLCDCFCLTRNGDIFTASHKSHAEDSWLYDSIKCKSQPSVFLKTRKTFINPIIITKLRNFQILFFYIGNVYFKDFMFYNIDVVLRDEGLLYMVI